MKKVYPLLLVLFFAICCNERAQAQIALSYTDTTVCPGMPLHMCASLTGQADPLSNDDGFSGVLDIGFQFTFFGKSYTKCLASGNGMITFDTAFAGLFAGWQWSQISVGNPPQANNSIFVVFMDLYLPAGGKIRYQRIGNPGNRKFIIEWCHLPVYGFNCNQLIVTTQAILYEGSNIIEIHTTKIPPIVSPCPTASSSSRAIQGVRNENGTLSFYPTNRDPSGSVAQNWGAVGIFHDGMRFTPNGTGTYLMDSIPYHPWIIIDSSSSASLKWYAQGQPNLPVASSSCASAIANVNVHYYTVHFNGDAGCEMDSVGFVDTVHIHFGTSYDTTQVEICAGSSYSWFGKNLFAPGNYDTLLTNYMGCDSFIRLQLKVNPLPDMTLKGLRDVEICEGSSTILSLLNPTVNVSYQWNKNNISVPSETETTIKASDPGKYTITGTTAKGCKATSLAFTLKVNANPVAKIQAIPNDIICAYDTLEMAASNCSATDFRWSPENLFRYITGAEGQIVKGIFTDPSTEVVLTVFNQYGCYDADTTLVRTKPCCWVSMPNAFTPNGDGVNDYFVPVLQPGQMIVTFKIFDRYGKEVYDNGNAKQGWNGAYKNGDQAQPGVYMYYLKYTCADGKLYDKKESITLIK